MKNIKTFVLLAVLIFISKHGTAQQDPFFTHYMYNMSILNPAYATDSYGVLKTGGMYRSQWVGVEGAPETATVFAHTTLKKNVEVGISVMHDEIGNILKENNVFADFAYVLPVSSTTNFSFGVKAGFTFLDANLSGVQLGEEGPDEAFDENLNEVFPNMGLGAYFFSNKYYIGVSAPRLFKSKHRETDNEEIKVATEAIHYYLTAGYVFDLNANFKLKPAFMVRAIPNAPVSVDLTVNVLFAEKFEVGVGYRFGNSITGLAKVEVLPNLQIGYAYDYNHTILGEFGSGSHEILLLYDLSLISPEHDKSPRFF